MTRKIILILLMVLTAAAARGQANKAAEADKLAEAFNAYKNLDFGTAFQLFKKVVAEGKNDEQKIVMARYYTADCLLNMNELDGAAEEFESFVQTYQFSNLREPALYKLGSIYFTKGDYRRCRDRLELLQADYPRSEFTGSSYYWIAQSLSEENKNIDAEENFREAISNKNTNKYVPYSIYSLAQVYEKTADYANAVKYYDDLLAYYKDGPLAPEAQLRIGICYFKMAQYDNAILELSDPLIKKLSAERLFDAKVFLANSFVRLKEYNDAIRIYDELLKTETRPEFLERINYNLAWINFQLNDYDKAFQIFDQLYKGSSDTLKSVSLFWSGECKRYAGDTKTANEIYKQFLSEYPQSSLAAKAQLAMGTVFYTKSGTSAEAEKSLLNATMSSDRQTRGKAYTLLGEMKLNKKNYEDAKKYFSEALKLTGDQKEMNDRAKFGIAAADFYSNESEAAVKYLEELRKKSPEFEPDKVNFYLAESYFALDKYSAALKSYNAVSPANEELRRGTLLGKAYSYFNLKDFANSTYYFSEYVNKYGNDRNIGEVKLRLADSYFGTKKFDKASAIYREIFSRERVSLDNDHAYYQYGQSLYKAGKPSDAVKVFDELQKKFPRSRYSDQSQYVIGWIHFQQGDFPDAITSYKELLDKYPRSSLKPMVYYSIGDGYFNQGEYDSSIVYYSTVITRFPGTQYVFDAVNGIQYAYVAKNEPEKAIDYINQFVDANPNSKFADQIFFKKGDLYYSIQKYDAAITAYKDFISHYPNSRFIPNAYYWMGKSAENMNKDDDAINYFLTAKQGALKSDIGISSSIELATIYSDKKQYGDAITVLNEVISAQPGSNRLPELLYLRGVDEGKNNQQADAYNTFNKIVSDFSGNVFVEKAKVELGLIEMQRNNLDAAQKYFKEVAEGRPDDIGAAAQYYYGVSLFNQNNIPDAITALVRVRSVYASFDEWYSKSLLMLGDCYVKMKDKKQARDMYRAVLTKHPTGDFAKEAKRKLNQL